ncbi:MAG: NAD-dependent dehydratase, partial [Chloroflexota bacterium]
MRVLVLGGDGYLGWAQAMYLSRKGFEVAVFDNMARRKFDMDEGFDSVQPIQSLHTRIATWEAQTGKTIDLFVGDIMDYGAVTRVFKAFA